MPDEAEKTRTRLCIVEEQEIFRQLYQAIFKDKFTVELLGDTLNEDCVNRIISRTRPDVLLVSAGRLDEDVFNNLSAVLRSVPRAGIFLLIQSGGQRDIELMRKLALSISCGLALFLKQSLDMADQLIGIVNSVAHGQIVLDPALSGKLLANQSACPFLQQMTAREQEILHLLANGYTNSAIAGTLVIDLKTVEHHINNLYSKLKSAVDLQHKHPRVQAARLYLEATGELLGTKE